MPGKGVDMALQHDHGLLSYQDYVGAVAQHVAVDTEAAAAAIARLAEDPALRQRMGEAGRLTVQQRFDWPVVARLHHQLYAELAERRRAGQEHTGSEFQHPLRGDPFRDFAPFATACLGPETELRLAMPLPELQHRLGNLTSLDRCYGHLRAKPAHVQRLLVQLEGGEGESCCLARLITAWPVDQHDDLMLSLTCWRNLAHSLVSPLGSAMNQAENPYRQDVFLEDLRYEKDHNSSVFGLNTSDAALLAAPWPDSFLYRARHRLRADAARFCPDSPAQRWLVLRSGYQSWHYRLW